MASRDDYLGTEGYFWKKVQDSPRISPDLESGT
jgi:hypothetical protein